MQKQSFLFLKQIAPYILLKQICVCLDCSQSVCGSVDWQWQHVFSAGWEFFSSHLSPPACEVRVKAEAGNGCATWEIIQLSDQRGHTRGLITPAVSRTTCEESWCVSHTPLTFWNIICILHPMLLLSWKDSLNSTQCQLANSYEINAVISNILFNVLYQTLSKWLVSFYQQCVLKQRW